MLADLACIRPVGSFQVLRGSMPLSGFGGLNQAQLLSTSLHQSRGISNGGRSGSEQPINVSIMKQSNIFQFCLTLLDQWGTGRAFTCKTADCGAELKLYLRAKLGACNCTTGVADDHDLDRMSDFDLVGGEVSPFGVGLPVTIAWMKGRSRAYALTAWGDSVKQQLMRNGRSTGPRAPAILRTW